MSLKNNYLSKLTGVLFLSAATILGVHEGRSLVAYKDSAGYVTICDGDTSNVKMGDVATPAECDARLKKAVEKHAVALAKLPDGLPDVVALGSLSLAYNIGSYGFVASSTHTALLMRNYSAASTAALRWKYITVRGKKYDCSQWINGKPNKVCYGLWERRQWEAKAIGNQFKSVPEAIAALPK